MPSIKSANPDFAVNDKPSTQTNYVHGLDRRRGPIPIAFQVTSPFDPTKVMLPHALVMHVNPQGFAETFTKKVERIQTRGGFVEQHWGDDIGDISCDGSTGAFMNLYTGLSSVVRQRTIAWDRYRDLYDLYRNNGSLIDPAGNIVLQGQIMLMYDRGTYLGHFKSFNVEETDDSPFAFKMSWAFRVMTTIYQVPTNDAQGFGLTPAFQGQNQTSGNFDSIGFGSTAAQSREESIAKAKADEANEKLKAEAELQKTGINYKELSTAGVAKFGLGNL